MSASAAEGITTSSSVFLSNPDRGLLAADGWSVREIDDNERGKKSARFLVLSKTVQRVGSAVAMKKHGDSKIDQNPSSDHGGHKRLWEGVVDPAPTPPSEAVISGSSKVCKLAFGDLPSMKAVSYTHLTLPTKRIV